MLLLLLSLSKYKLFFFYINLHEQVGFPLNAYIPPHLNVHKYKDIVSEVQMLKRNTNFGLHTLITFLVFFIHLQN